MNTVRDLGAATEARILAAFANACMITAGAAAALLGVDEKTLGAMTDDQVIRAVRVGKVRRYTEADVRLYLAEGPDLPCRSTSRPKAASTNTISGPRVVAFTARPASKPAARRRP
jgi:excisionase family DNA binding protein